MTVQPSRSPMPDLAVQLGRQLARLESNPDDVDAWRSAAALMAELGRLDDAIAAQQQAVERAPDAATPWLELASYQARYGLRDVPEASVREALRVDPLHIDARARLGRMRLRAGDLDEAGACFRTVLGQNPAHADATAGAALVLDRRGHVEDAWALLVQTPADLSSSVALAMATVARHRNTPAKALPAVRRAWKKARGADQAVLLHAEGDLYDALGDPDRAWRAWTMANQARRLSFDTAAHERAIDAIIAVSTPERVAPTGPQDPRPVFVVGMPRSGTTLVETLLDAHPEVFGAGELEALRDLAVALPREIGAGRTWLDHADALGAWGPAIGQAYLEHVVALAPDAARIVDKMPNNALHLALVGVALPGARIVWVERDPDDVAVSCFQKPLAPGLPWATSMQGIRSWQRGLSRLKAHWEATLSQPIHTLRYEDLVADPEGTVRRLCAFLDLPFAPEMLDFHRGRRQVATASWDQVTQPLHAGRVGRSIPFQSHL